ncbi:MAG: type I-C CRISPR-associated protein Cas8c/Csd1 [Oscillospiraceae bacterium]|jgi:CRISPR-associated protein Csd1|nr:type I-C CRISPR-associated protein Cas8c/Csd1 [Oscillospiraceae bacterium]
MIINALVRRYESAREVEPGWQKRKADYIIDISADGSILPSSHENKTEYVLPELPKGRTSGIKASFLCDEGGYLFGIEDEKEKHKRGAEKYAKSKELHTQLLRDIDSPAARAICAFFDNAEEHTVPPGIGRKTVCLFAFEGKRIIDYPEIRNVWNNIHSENADGKLCLVTGKIDTEAKLHGNIKGLGKDSPSLINANKPAFTSYGRTQKDPAAQIGEYATFAYVTALNDLLHKGSKHRQSIGADTVVYWAEDEVKESEIYSGCIGPNTVPNESGEEQLSAIMEKAANGKLPDMEGVTWEKPFYVLCLSLQMKRISVRFFHTSSFGSVIGKLTEHYRNLEIYSSRDEKFKHIPYWILLAETTVKGSASDAAPLLGGQLINSIITGARYPAPLYNAILTRIRAGGDINRAKAAIIKAVLIRNFNEEVSMALNPNSADTAYTLGRLFATIERLQHDANGASTVHNGYFSKACANPASAFPTLLKLSEHHKVDKAGLQIVYAKRKGELLDILDIEQTPFPAALSLEDQGRFILGYYHQTQDLYRSKEDGSWFWRDKSEK